MAKHIGIYVRISSLKQSHASQEPDLKRYAEGQELPVQFWPAVKNLLRAL